MINGALVNSLLFYSLVRYDQLDRALSEGPLRGCAFLTDEYHTNFIINCFPRKTGRIISLRSAIFRLFNSSKSKVMIGN